METISRIQRVSEDSTLKHTGGIGRIVRTFIARRPRTALIILLVLVGLVVLAYMRFDGASPEEKAQKELAAAVAAVGELMILPEGDEPVLATVTDAAALTAQQAFFTGAIDGDQLLLFPKNLKAVIYSPSRNKIINAGPIEQSPLETTGSQANPVSNVAGPSSVAVAVAPDTISVEVRNGSGITGKASEVVKSIVALGGFEAHATDATSNDYTKSVVVAIKNTDSARAGANTLASALGTAVVSALPATEKSSSADVVLILGSDHTQ